MIRKILIRFDDICPTMDWNQWSRAVDILDKYDVKPLIGIIPDNHDPELMIESPREDYWDYIHSLADKGYSFAMHGYQHLYDSNCRGAVNNSYVSEFAGHSYEIQLQKISEGKRILNEFGIYTDTFFAPSHSYDKNTLKALAACGFKYISDGKSKKLFTCENICCIPCRSGGVPVIRSGGFYTAVFHTHEWVRPGKKVGYDNLKRVCEKYSQDIVSFNEFIHTYPKGNDIFQEIDEKIFVFYERHVHPILSKIKHKIIRRQS